MADLTYEERQRMRRLAEDAHDACNRHYGPFVDAMAHPLNVLALLDMAARAAQTANQAPAVPSAQLGALQSEIAGHEASNRHLSAMVDELRELLQDAKRAMTELHEAAIPDESSEGVPAIIAPAAFRKFVDAHAILCSCLHQRGHNPEQGQQATSKFATGGVLPPGIRLVGESGPELEPLKK